MSNHDQNQAGRIVDPRAAANGGKTPGAAGHPEPGSQHDDSKLETVAEGPDVPIVDGQPGAFGDVETVGGAATQTSMEGKATEVGG
jgi:hypothetical protein